MEKKTLNATNRNTKGHEFRFVVLSLLLVVIGVLPIRAEAATLYFSPSAGSFDVGKTLVASVFVSSSDQAINAVSGSISFPADKLEALSVSKAGSVISLWVQEPFFSNSGAIVNFEGIVLNPGFTGSSGKIITATFRIKAAGTASVAFSAGSVLANDGKGTNILSSLGSAAYSLSAQIQPTPSPAPSSVVGVPVAPKVSSPTHLDSNTWYSNKNPQFSWALPADVNGVSIHFSQSPSSNPGSVTDGLFASKSYDNIEDGIWYFHIKFRNPYDWGSITHFKVQIDTEKPNNFDITEVRREDPAEQKAAFSFDAKDRTSGIDHYEVQIDSESSQIWQDDGSHRYETSATNPGKHTLIAKAVDKAGNYLTDSAEFAVEPIESPALVTYPQVFTIRGVFSVLAVLVFMVAPIFLLVFLLWRGSQKIASWKGRVKKEVKEAEQALHTAISILKEDIADQIKLLENAKSKRALTEEEEKIAKRLKKNLDDVEKFVRKEIKDIEREVR